MYRSKHHLIVCHIVKIVHCKSTYSMSTSVIYVMNTFIVLKLHYMTDSKLPES